MNYFDTLPCEKINQRKENWNIIGREPWSSGYGMSSFCEGHGLEPWHCTGHFFTLICWKNCSVYLKRNENKWKRGQGWPIFSKSYNNMHEVESSHSSIHCVTKTNHCNWRMRGGIFGLGIVWRSWIQNGKSGLLRYSFLLLSRYARSIYEDSIAQYLEQIIGRGFQFDGRPCFIPLQAIQGYCFDVKTFFVFESKINQIDSIKMLYGLTGCCVIGHTPLMQWLELIIIARIYHHDKYSRRHWPRYVGTWLLPHTPQTSWVK